MGNTKAIKMLLDRAQFDSFLCGIELLDDGVDIKYVHCFSRVGTLLCHHR